MNPHTPLCGRKPDHSCVATTRVYSPALALGGGAEFHHRVVPDGPHARPAKVVVAIPRSAQHRLLQLFTAGVEDVRCTARGGHGRAEALLGWLI